MPVRPIVRLGHPALRTVARPVPLDKIGDPEIPQHIADMGETMHEARGVGLAAPQVAAELQIFVYASMGHPDPAADIPLRLVINPMIAPQERELVHDWEGCLSI